tara:strand:+ start:102 stop:407 length:306 start_codon:yes stop_codon:yes gene_type:complete
MRLLSLLLMMGFLCADGSSSLSKASAALNAGLFEDALKHISVAQKEDPKNSEMHRMKAFLHEALDDPKNALESWKACLKHSENKNIRREAKIHIKNLMEEM